MNEGGRNQSVAGGAFLQDRAVELTVDDVRAVEKHGRPVLGTIDI